MSGFEVRCSSPTCGVRVVVHSGHRYLSELRTAGWVHEIQPGDAHSQPYCPRCKL